MTLQIRNWKAKVTEYSGQPIFLRYGIWECRSLNFCTGEREIGISVYRAKVSDGAVCLDDIPDSRYVNELRSRFVFPVTGSVVGTGSDGEPLLRNVKVVNLPISLSGV